MNRFEKELVWLNTATISEFKTGECLPFNEMNNNKTKDLKLDPEEKNIFFCKIL